MATWTVKVGNGNIIVLDRTADGLVDISIPTGRVTATRAEVEDLRRKLGAAIADEGSQG